MCWAFALMFLLGSLDGTAHADLVGPPPGSPQARDCKDLIADFAEAQCSNASVSEVNPIARSGGSVLPAIFLHPGGLHDAVAAFPALPVPALEAGARAFLVFRPAMSDGITWDSPLKPNGVLFAVEVEGRRVYEELLAAPGWHTRAVDLTPWAGQAVRLEFHTNSVESNAAYDWALFGRPRVVVVQPEPSPQALADDSAGLVLARVRCGGAAKVRVRCGEATDTADLPAGEHWLPLSFSGPPQVALEAESGVAQLVEVLAAPWTYRVQIAEASLTSPLVTARRPFRARLLLRNVGEGLYPGGDEASFRLGNGSAVPAAAPRLAPGRSEALVGPAFRVDRPSRTSLQASFAGQATALAVNVLPVEPVLSPRRPGGVEVSVRGGEGLLAIASNPWSRIAVVAAPSGEAYGIAQTWDGERWVRVGTLYPLARLVVADAGGVRRDLPVVVSAATGEGGELVLRADAGVAGPGGRWPLRITLTPAADAPRIGMTWELKSHVDARVLCFAGPTFLVGDRSFGARKDFALFPGLEYLEGDEESSSTRDLAPPLKDRRVPVAWKIATPLMAVQSRGCLAGLLWDAKQAWTPGQTLPAARFVAPARSAGLEYAHLSLFAPSVGKWVAENQAEAAVGYPVTQRQRLRLSAQVLLDHEARYPADSPARTPHRGGLVLQAMDHWFALFGLPEPSPQPRSWEAQRDLSRSAFLETLWSEKPPGWPSFRGQPLGTDTEALVPLTLDLRDGLAPEVAAEVRARMEKVATYAVNKAGPGALLSGNRVVLPYHYGYLAECLRAYRQMAEGMLGQRENGRWVWRPGDVEHAALGVPGTATLGQAAYPCLVALRAARFTGDADLARRALEAVTQMDEYQVPRGASMWECPQYQPDIFAAALAIKAYCEAYRLTGDRGYLQRAGYWARTGLPFLYTWQMPGLTGMLYNSIGVMGSTYFTHSWIGRPVVWMGLDYAYALQDLAALDDSFPWRKLVQGVTNSAMHQQVTSPPELGLFPDSWEMATNSPNAPYLNPGLILVNEWRLRGLSAEVRQAWVGEGEGRLALNAGVDIVDAGGSVEEGVRFGLAGSAGMPAHASLAPVPEPREVTGCGERVSDGAALPGRDAGWQYDPELRALIVKAALPGGNAQIEVAW